jgi:hypothetical protein
MALLTVAFQRVHPQPVAGVSVAHVGTADDDTLDGDPGRLLISAIVEGQVVGGEAGLVGMALIAPTAEQGEEEQDKGESDTLATTEENCRAANEKC